MFAQICVLVRDKWVKSTRDRCILPAQDLVGSPPRKIQMKANEIRINQEINLDVCGSQLMGCTTERAEIEEIYVDLNCHYVVLNL